VEKERCQAYHIKLDRSSFFLLLASCFVLLASLSDLRISKNFKVKDTSEKIPQALYKKD